MRKTLLIISAVVFLFGLNGNLRADEIEEEINGALSAYKAKEYRKASERLDFVAQKIRQLKAEKILALFPEPLPGWSARDAESSSVGSMFMGGVISGSKEYLRGKSTVKITITTDNPMIGVVSAILSNPMMMQMGAQFGAATGQEITRIKDEKALAEWDPGSGKGSIKMVIDNNALVSVEGSDCPREDLRRYAEAMDFNKIKAYISE